MRWKRSGKGVRAGFAERLARLWLWVLAEADGDFGTFSCRFLLGFGGPGVGGEMVGGVDDAAVAADYRAVAKFELAFVLEAGFLRFRGGAVLGTRGVDAGCGVHGRIVDVEGIGAEGDRGAGVGLAAVGCKGSGLRA